MLDDAVYYSRREADERAAARQSGDLRVRQIHSMLADRYAQLAQRSLAALPAEGGKFVASPPVGLSAAARTPRRFR